MTLATHTEARSRVEALVDRDSFMEFGGRALPPSGQGAAGDGVVTGTASAARRPITVFAQDAKVQGGSLGQTHATKIVYALQRAMRARRPVVGLCGSGGARIQEGVAALDGYGAVFRANVQASGRIPQISTILGPCAGGAVYSPALTDIVIMQADRGQMFLTGPAVVREVTGEDVTGAQLGGAQVHARESGLTHLTAVDEADALMLTRQVLSYLPTSCWDELPSAPPLPAEPMPAVPADQRQVYDVRAVLRGIINGGSLLELQPAYAPNLVIGFAHLQGRPVGVVANQPLRLGGVLNARAGEKGARFVRLCDAFGLPIITLVDTPGFLPGRRQEADGVIRRGAKLLYAFAEATVPRITVITRKAFGGAYIVMSSKSLGADLVYAWPTAQIAVMGAEGAVNILHRRALTADPDRRTGLIENYENEVMVPERAAEQLSVDDIIEPGHTRDIIASGLHHLGPTTPAFRHDNLPQ